MKGVVVPVQRFLIRNTAAVLLAIIIFSGVLAEDSDILLSTACVSRGSNRVPFQYPEACRMVDEGSIGTYVYLTESEYVTLMIPKKNLSGTEAVREAIGDFGEILELSDSMNVFAVHGDENHRMPFLDVVEIGVNLPDGTGVMVCTYCPCGQTEVYGLLLTILDSMTDTAVLEDWLNDVWMPMLSEQS